MDFGGKWTFPWPFSVHKVGKYFCFGETSFQLIFCCFCLQPFRRGFKTKAPLHGVVLKKLYHSLCSDFSDLNHFCSESLIARFRARSITILGDLENIAGNRFSFFKVGDRYHAAPHLEKQIKGRRHWTRECIPETEPLLCDIDTVDTRQIPFVTWVAVAVCFTSSSTDFFRWWGVGGLEWGLTCTKSSLGKNGSFVIHLKSGIDGGESFVGLKSWCVARFLLQVPGKTSCLINCSLVGRIKKII